MKTSYLPVTLALLIGIGIGWLVKPAAEPASAEPSASRRTKLERPGRAVVAANDDTSDAGPTKSSVRTMVIGEDDAELPKEAKEMQEKMAEAMTDSQRKQDERRIAELVERLGLDAGQETALRDYFEKRRGAIAGLFSGDGTAPDLEAMGNGRQDELMAEILSDEQSQAYAELKTAEREQKVESQALKDLAKLNGMIDLRPDQKDAVYQILYDDAGAKVDRAEQSGVSGMMEVMGSGFGMDLDSAMLHDTYYLAEEADEAGDDSATALERLRARQRETTEAQVKRMEGVLDAKQLEAYREHLETKGSIFDSMMSEPGE